MAAIAQPSTGNPWRSFSLDWLTFWLTYASAVNCGCICLSQRSHRDTKPSTESLMSAFVKPSREIKAIPTDHNGWFVLIHPSKMRGRLFRARDSPDAQRGGKGGSPDAYNEGISLFSILFFLFSLCKRRFAGCLMERREGGTQSLPDAYRGCEERKE